MDTDQYYIIKENSVFGEYREKGSKFFAYGHRVYTVQEAKEVINHYRSVYPDARHHCSAYRLKYAENSNIKTLEWADDDGEPGHSAGDPILNQLRAFDLYNTIIVVIRYFGGTKLGVSGLINAYKTAAYDYLINVETAMESLKAECMIAFPYSYTGNVENLCRQFGAEIKERQYAEECFITVEIRLNIKASFKDALSNASNIRIEEEN